MKPSAVVAMLVLSACGGRAVAPATPIDPVEVTQPAAPIARPGEEMTYRISIHNIEVANLVVSVGAAPDFEGRDAVVVQTRATSSKILAWVHPVDDTLSSWIDRTTGRPIAYQTSELKSRGGDVETSEIHFGPGKFLVHVVNGAKVLDEDQVVRDLAYDVPSMLTFLRTWDGQPGAQVSLDVMRSRRAWRATVAVAGFENLTTALGDLPVVRYDGQAVRLERDGSEETKAEPRKFSMWISDDADRVPARMRARTDWGDIDVELVGYRAQ